MEEVETDIPAVHEQVNDASIPTQSFMHVPELLLNLLKTRHDSSRYLSTPPEIIFRTLNKYKIHITSLLELATLEKVGFNCAFKVMNMLAETNIHDVIKAANMFGIRYTTTPTELKFYCDGVKSINRRRGRKIAKEAGI